MKHITGIENQLHYVFDGEGDTGAFILLGEKYSDERFELQAYCDGDVDFIFTMITEQLSHMFANACATSDRMYEYVDYFNSVLEAACDKKWDELHNKKYLQ